MTANTTKPTSARPPSTPPTIAPVLLGVGAGGSGFEGDRVDVDDAMDLDGRIKVGREGRRDGVDDAVVGGRVGGKEAGVCIDEASKTVVGVARK